MKRLSWALVLVTLTASLGHPAVTSGQVGRYQVQVAESDARLLGGADYHDDFANPASGWGEESGDGYARGYIDGEYRVWMGDAGLSWRILDGAPQVDGHFDAELSARQTGTGGLKWYGLFFRAQDEDHGYSFAVAPGSRQYTLYRLDGDTPTILVGWTTSYAIHTGADSNLLRVECRGAEIALVANGETLCSLSDARYSAGLIGLEVVNYQASGGVEVFFDDLAVYGPDATATPTQPAPVQASDLSPGADTLELVIVRRSP